MSLSKLAAFVKSNSLAFLYKNVVANAGVEINLNFYWHWMIVDYFLLLHIPIFPKNIHHYFIFFWPLTNLLGHTLTNYQRQIGQILELYLPMWIHHVWENYSYYLLHVSCAIWLVSALHKFAFAENSSSLEEFLVRIFIFFLRDGTRV